MAMDGTVYEFDSKIKYRKLNPKRFTVLCILGMVIPIPSVTASILPFVFANHFFDKLNAVQIIICLIILLVNLAVMTASVYHFRSEARIYFSFFSNAFNARIGMNDYRVPYESITHIRCTSTCWHFYTSSNKYINTCYILARDSLGDVSVEEFNEFIKNHIQGKFIDVSHIQ
ncbi:MAG: YcxB family protein [Oscillospiraceae bacterium]|nr:YcxB family protein [Oscillospiraceae bacterium]